MKMFDDYFNTAYVCILKPITYIKVLMLVKL
uniref:Uncharacterized protein n=1 Tax=Arundo donax TaxID=35708 RepID=A0A0A8YSY5_ARUDO